MTNSPSDDDVIRAFTAAGQGHVFRFLDSLDGAARDALFEQARGIDLANCGALHAVREPDVKGREVEPPGTEVIRRDTTVDHRRMRASSRERGVDEIAAGRLAVVVAAGGQGTRLGSTAPKGMWPCGPASGKPLLHWLAEKTLYWSRKTGGPIPFVLMVSAATEAATLRFLRWHQYFGLDPTWVRTARQASLPALDDSGRLLLAARNRIAMAPNGHGGLYRALRDAKLLDLLADHGVRTLSYVQVDNPMILPVDPVFLGFHLRRESLISSKSVRKTEPGERVGVFARVDGRSAVLEYSELTPQQATSCEVDGSLSFSQGSIAAHCIDLGFARRMADHGLPIHRARKSVPYVDETGAVVRPETPNATKFETFLFDAIPLAERSLVLETRREDEFSPIKNSAGNDSPATARRDLEGMFRRWMTGVGKRPPATGAVEIPPLTAPDEYEYRVGMGRPGDR